MSYQVIARKWRPKSFKELIGQHATAQILLNAFKANRMPHALLFTGPRGTGKTSSARIVAKTLRCENLKEFSPCGQCTECENINSGSSLNVIEIDGASNNGVDSIRELRDTVNYMPSSGKSKIYIIDEVHMLSTSAFNALLKTLEEPPSHVTFIMATTEAHKIPITILSRCQRFDFKTISASLIVSQLEKICKAEKIQAEKEALWLIAKQSGGSMRDSQSLLDQMITFSGKQMNLEQVTEILGLTNRELLYLAVKNIISGDQKLVLKDLKTIFEKGYDPELFCKDLIEVWRDLLFCKMMKGSTKNTQIFDSLSDAQFKALSEISENIDEPDIHLLFDASLKGFSDIKQSPVPNIALEMLLLRLAIAPKVKDINDIFSSQKNQANQNQPLNNNASNIQPHTQSNPKKSYQNDQAKSQTYTNGSNTYKAKPLASINTTPTQANTDKKTDFSEIKDPWIRFVKQAKQEDGFLGALLENTQIVSQTEKTLTLGVPEKMSFLLDKLSNTDSKAKIKSLIQNFWSKNLDIEVELLKTSEKSATPKQLAVQKKEIKDEEDREFIENHPTIKKVKKLFNAEIVSIKEKS